MTAVLTLADRLAMKLTPKSRVAQHWRTLLHLIKGNKFIMVLILNDEGTDDATIAVSGSETGQPD